MSQATRQVLRVSRLIELDCDLFAIRHLAKVRKVGANDRHTIGTSEMGNAAATRG